MLIKVCIALGQTGSDAMNTSRIHRNGFVVSESDDEPRLDS
jgi:hypothetical protein